MTRVKRTIAMGLVAVLLGLSGATPAYASPYIDHLCMNNPAYRSMHENECLLGGSSRGDQPNGGGGGLIGRIIKRIGGLLS